MPWPRINPGELRHQVVIQSLDTTQTATGDTPDPTDNANWSTFCTAWAKIEPVNGRELQEAGKQFGEVTSTITIRYQPGILETMRVYFEANDKRYDIRAVLNVDERNVLLKLLCRERK